ncbi:MAG: acetolactate decarboxylase [Spirochaetales bacterium]|nr:acetolactate decarboxylase [Spirochaetales bacterium]
MQVVFYFITADKRGGGHLLALELNDGMVMIDDTADFFMSLPENREFMSADFEKKEEEIKSGEKDR